MSEPRGQLNKEDILDRVLLHVPIGIFSVCLIFLHWSAVLAFTGMFLAYELNDDRHSKDQAWKDVYGWLVGAAIAGIGLIIFKLIL